MDVNSSWVQRQVNNAVRNHLIAPAYAAKALPGNSLDIKSSAPSNIGSQRTATRLLNLEDGTPIYATARDGGNFIAGIIQQDGWASNRFFSIGFGSLNVAQTELYFNNKYAKGIELPIRMGGKVLGRYFEDVVGGSIFESSLQPPFFGEDIGTGQAILEGRTYHRDVGWDRTPISGSTNSGMGSHAGRSPSYPQSGGTDENEK